MKCVKVPRRDLSQVKIPKAPGYDIVFEGDFALIPIIEDVKGLEVVECLPKKRDVTPRLNEIVNGISSFYIIGDIMVLSPKNELPRETLQKILDMYKVRSIYVKKRVSGELRVSELIHLAGEKRTTTTFSENGIKYFVNISKVYVNPSMATERIKMAEVIPPGSIVLDAFTGYGLWRYIWPKGWVTRSPET
ncbi:hypothetical protein [Metallosphaera hakonensis]|uniref:hypothetical protein n=1 Tax=Metallosphaera hakonensis TaxID=79601 RepID=UPI000A4B49FE|nr:hypothetical protein [Metallosphaera hakonensis]